MAEVQPSRQQTDLAEMIEMLLDKGVVINADIAVSVGDTQLLGIQLRAAIASFETAAQYGLEFPEGTDMQRVKEASGRAELEDDERPDVSVDPTKGVNITGEDEEEEAVEGDESEDEAAATAVASADERGTRRLGARPEPERPVEGGTNLLSDDEGGDEDEGESEAEDGTNEAESDDEPEEEATPEATTDADGGDDDHD